MGKGLKKKPDNFPKKTYKGQEAHEKIRNIANHQGNATHLTTVRMTTIKTKKRSLFHTVGGNVNWSSCYGKWYEGSQKIKNRTAI